MNRRARLGTGAALAACLLAAAPPARAQEKHALLPFEGSHGFRHILNAEKLKPLASAAELVGRPAGQVVIIVLGDPRALDEVRARVGNLERFRRSGGAILIATDRPADRLADLGVRVTGAGVLVDPERTDGDRPLAYQGHRTCPVLYGLDRSGHPLFQGLGRGLVTNNPSDLLPARANLLPALAHFAPECYKPRHFPDRYLTLMAGSDRGPGRVLVIADRTVFMNGMLALPDADNWQFAWNVARWLSDGGQRKYALLIEDGRVMTNFDVPLMQFPMPPFKAVGRLLRVVEEENLFNRFILANIPRERLLRFVFLGVSGLLLLYGLFRLVRAHHRGETAAPLVAVRVGEQAAAGLPLVALRNEAALREGNCYEAARDLARLCFEGEGGERPAEPPVVARGGRHLRREVERLWRLAYGASPTPVSPTEFAGLAASAARVRAALDDGSLHGTGTGSANGSGGVA